MEKLTQEAFKRIYKDKSGEGDYEAYQQLVNNISATLADIENINDINTDVMLNLKYIRFRQYLNPKFVNIRDRLEQFSEFSVQDPLYESLTNFREFIVEHIDVVENYETKRKELIQFIENSNLPPKVYKKSKNFILEKIFDDERSVKQIIVLDIDFFKDGMTKSIAEHLKSE